MDAAIITTLISTSGAVVVGLGGMWISTNQLGKRLDDFSGRLNRLEDSVSTSRDIINSKLSSIDLEISRLLDKIK
jgi:predicted RNA-binding protein with PIN domain